MSAMSPVFDLANATMLPPLESGPRPIPRIEGLVEKWEAVHDAAEAVGNLAQLGREEPSSAVLTLPLRAADRGGRHYDAVARGIDDLSAVMQPGLRALLALSAAGKDPTAAALTLWREFHRSRAAILGLVEAG